VPQLNPVSSAGVQVSTADDPKVSVRIIGRCNFRCPACSTFSGPERPGLLAVVDFARIADLLAGNGFHGPLHISGGETTLHPGLPEIAAAAAAALPKARIAIFTNGDWVGGGGWRGRLRGLLAGPNVLVRFSLDKPHVLGRAAAIHGAASAGTLAESERELFEKAREFLEACLQEGAEPGINFDFAFKGTIAEGRAYLAPLGSVPVYPIAFQKDPLHRPKRLGFMAVDLDKDGRALVYPSLGHIPAGEPLGGIETLPSALEMNRRAIAGGD
jgi:hypothetical protein